MGNDTRDFGPTERAVEKLTRSGIMLGWTFVRSVKSVPCYRGEPTVVPSVLCAPAKTKLDVKLGGVPRTFVKCVAVKGIFKVVCAVAIASTRKSRNGLSCVFKNMALIKNRTNSFIQILAKSAFKKLPKLVQQERRLTMITRRVRFEEYFVVAAILE